MGDSFMAGQGGWWIGNPVGPVNQFSLHLVSALRTPTEQAVYGSTFDDHAPGMPAGNGTGCHRSEPSEAHDSGIPVVTTINIACSGARTANIRSSTDFGEWFKGEAPQADQLSNIARDHRVTVIVLSVSGNDLGFGDIIAACAEANATGKPLCQPAQQQKIVDAMPAAMDGLRHALQDIRTTMSDRGYGANDYRLIVQGYPNLLPSGSRLIAPGARTANGCPFYTSDADWTRDWVLPTFAANIRAEAGRAGAQFVDMQQLFLGHELCSVSSTRTFPGVTNTINEMEWIHMLSVAKALQWTEAQQEESLHPNAYGHQIMATCIGQVYMKPVRRDYECRSDAHTSLVTVSPLAMLANGSFDSALDPHWQIWNAGGIVDAPSHTGRAVRIGASPASVYQTIAVQPNTTYSVSGWGMVGTPGEVVQIGATVGGQIIKRAVDRLPKRP
jgi:lysophospholipase L1-like esterase